MLFDPQLGLLVWAPFGVLAFLALELLARSLREQLSVALPVGDRRRGHRRLPRRAVRHDAAVATFGVPVIEGPFFPGRDLLPAVPVGAALCAWALRHEPRVGAALAAVTVAGGAWLVIAGQFADATLAPPDGPAAVGRRRGARLRGTRRPGAPLARELWRERELEASAARTPRRPARPGARRRRGQRAAAVDHLVARDVALVGLPRDRRPADRRRASSSRRRPAGTAP